MSLNRGHTYSEQVGPEAHDLALLDYLVRRYPHSTRDCWHRRILDGLVRVAGRPADPRLRLRRGQRVEWCRPPWREPDAPTDLALLYRDSRLLALAKPAGLPTLPGGGFLDRTLLAQVRRRFPEAAPMHRLGRFTSGVVLCARDVEARRGIAAAWRQGRVRRGYVALCSGEPSADLFHVDVPIGPVPYPPLGTLHAACARGRAAATRVRVLERRRDGFLARIDIATGRPHQIRIHLAAAGHPLVGDPLYRRGGQPDPAGRALPGDPGYRLHADRIALPHPGDGSTLAVYCSPPPGLRTAPNPENPDRSGANGPTLV